MKECEQIPEMVLLDKKGMPKNLLWCINFLSHSHSGSLCLPFSSFTACLALSFSLHFFTLSNLCFYIPLSACRRLFGPSSFHSLSPFAMSPCPSLSLSFLSLLYSLSLETTILKWRRTCPKTFPFLQYCGLKILFSPHVFCLSKCSVMEPLVIGILNLQVSQKQLFQSNYLH